MERDGHIWLSFDNEVMDLNMNWSDDDEFDAIDNDLLFCYVFA